VAAQVVGDDAEVAGESTADLRREAKVALREAVDEDERGTDRIAPFIGGEPARYFEVNVMSGVRLSRAYLPGMMERRWGRVIFISSESALNIPADMIHYGMTKTAMLALSRGLAKRAAGTGVTVNSILPGPTLSEGVAEMLKKEMATNGRSLDEVAAAFVAAQRPSSIIRRPASAEEVANMVVYAASPQASATTGAALRVDGGVVDTIA
jgi:NAD(P)-dependent dehydrogenase (short-subunit alcohol dehydrogenase family)